MEANFCYLTTLVNNDKKFKKFLKIFEKEWSNTKSVYKSIFVDDYKEDIEYLKLYMSAEKHTMFESDNEHEPVSQIFKEFIKGITYFQHQHSVETSVYSRLCYDNSWDKEDIDLLNSIERKRMYYMIEFKAIERLIYLKLSNVTYDVWTNHNDSRIPYKLTIQLDYVPNTNIPIKLEVVKTSNVRQICIAKYEYERSLDTKGHYLNVVKAKMINRKGTYERLQRFDLCTKWNKQKAD